MCMCGCIHVSYMHVCACVYNNIMPRFCYPIGPFIPYEVTVFATNTYGSGDPASKSYIFTDEAGK